jgi:hypothetical protein
VGSGGCGFGCCVEAGVGICINVLERGNQVGRSGFYRLGNEVVNNGSRDCLITKLEIS